ncbi:MAG TPA: ABC transporter permease [Cyclobacteriaceae bacterium]|nr:ABC transporter permease [Cyclobacteriaceae bacterium]
MISKVRLYYREIEYPIVGDSNRSDKYPKKCNRAIVINVLVEIFRIMLKNYLVASIRSLRKHFSYSAINIIGMGIGLATCILLSTWISHELSYDRFHQNANRIYRGSLEYSFGGQTSKTSVSPTALLPVLKKNFAEVETGVRVYNPSSWNPYVLKNNDKLFQEKKFYYADSTFFQVFSFRLLRGNPRKALTEPNSVVLSQSSAKKYFGTEDVLGKTFTVNNKTEYKVTGLMEDLPSNSMIKFDFVGSFSSLEASKEQIWWSANYQTFLVITPQANVSALREKINALVKRELASELTGKGDYVVYNFVPLTDIYLKSDVDEPEVTGNIQYVYIFSAIALLVLIIACINYINLATAKAAGRAKEVGVRKVAGALRSQLFTQFISESLVITFFAFCLAFFLAELALPSFNSLTGKSFIYGDLFQIKFLLTCFLTWLTIGFVAGAYPAIALSAFKPASVLKGNFKNSGQGVWLRQALVVFQFTVSIILMVGTAVIVKQINFIQNRKLGYDKENMIILPLDNKTRDVYDQLKTEFERTGKIAGMARSTEAPTKIKGGFGLKIEGAASEKGMIVTATAIDKDFIPTTNMKLVAGRNLTEGDFQKVKSDTLFSFIVNQSAVKELGLTPEKAIGVSVNLSGRKGGIIAVVEDFHFSSLHEKIGPLVLFSASDNWDLSYSFVRLKPGDFNSTLAELKSICAALLPHRPFEYEFLDQQYQKLYDNEQRMGSVTTLFAGLAIAIACLGLLGLVAYAAAQKTKEIGIRKVLGATSPGIVGLITASYMKLVIIAIFIGLPAAYWVMNTWWLESFAYHATIGIAPLVLAALSCIAIAFATASFQAVKAAWVDPATTLRSE